MIIKGFICSKWELVVNKIKNKNTAGNMAILSDDLKVGLTVH